MTGQVDLEVHRQVVHMFQHDISYDHMEPPSAAFEYSRRLAQRGVPVNALVRAYRLGQDQLLKSCFAEIGRQVENRETAFLVSHRYVTGTFNYVDWISQQVVAVYEEERERWLENRSAVRMARVKELIKGIPLDIDTAESAIGYRLRQRHVGLILWTRTWVQHTLGPLAVDDDQNRRLRETVMVFLTEGCSYTSAADVLMMHKNSVKYRIAKAEEVRGAPIGRDRVEVEMALLACRWLGRSVLVTER